MSEWSIEHAWKSTSRVRADAHQIPLTHFRFSSFRNIDRRQRVLVNDGVRRGFTGGCDTVLTRFSGPLPRIRLLPPTAESSSTFRSGAAHHVATGAAGQHSGTSVGVRGASDGAWLRLKTRHSNRHAK